MAEDKMLLKNIEGDTISRDPDDTKAAREFYSTYWKDSINYNNDSFRGDTIISFNTIAGCTIRLLSVYDDNFSMPRSQKARLDIITESKEVQESLREKFNEFYNIYHTLANFMPLPRLTSNEPKRTYLQSVKNLCYHEFPDLFLKDIYLYYITGKSNPRFAQGTNSKYFDTFGQGLEGWKNYIEKNYLQDFFNDTKYKQYIPLGTYGDIKLPYNKRISRIMSAEAKNECLSQIEIILTNALKIIKNRSLRLKRPTAITNI